MVRNHWKEFFTYEAARYDSEAFTSNTRAEVDFIIRELSLSAGSKLLDIGCGTGRHSVELARRGFVMTGVDLSEQMLDIARAKAHKAQANIEFICANAVDFRREGAFDACICLCEGALSLFGSSDDPYNRDLAIFRNMHASLRPGGKLLITALNGCRMIRKYQDVDVAAGRFDVLKTMEITSAQGLIGRDIPLCEKSYIPTELRLLLEIAGFEVQAIYGGTAGSWNKQAPKLDEIELMAIATRH